jgi:predicted nucleotide-binding protein (sugar kinase/HSP70/actin superfamily)
VTAHDAGYDGVIVIGPLNCLPFRISEAILKPHCIHAGVPILTYESDGRSVPLGLMREVEVHIQQVLRAARRHQPVPVS